MLYLNLDKINLNITFFMFTRIYSASVLGIFAKKVSVEIDISNGFIQWNIVGLPDAAVKESKQRISAAIKNSGIMLPDKKITVNLSPADMKKEGSIFDMPIALALLDACGIISIPNYLKNKGLFVGEIRLDGTFIGTKGIFTIVADANILDMEYVIVPFESAKEAALIKNIKIIAPKSLQQLLSWIIEDKIEFFKNDNEEFLDSIKNNTELDLEQVNGNLQAKRAMQIAAAGHHATLLIGSPGSGKTMLAERFITILPEMTLDEKIEVTKIHAASNQLKDLGLVKNRPFSSPHHTISDIGMVGGGSYPQPGCISLAHNGVLFLDELLEYKRSCLEVLRQPLESNKITITRSNAEYTFPARFLLIAATNPCPCGYYGDKRNNCSCSIHLMKKYIQKLSGPLIDRIDMHIGVYSQDGPFEKEDQKKISSADLYKKIKIARDIQEKRYRNKYTLNGLLNGAETIKYCLMSDEAKKEMESIYKDLSLSMRGYFKIIKIARTIADLEESDLIKIEHIYEAHSYRIIDKLIK